MICTKYNDLSFRDVQDQFIPGHPFQTDCNFLLRVSVTSLAVVAGEYMVDASGRSLVKIEKSRGPRELPCSTPHLTCLILEKLPLKKTL